MVNTKPQTSLSYSCSRSCRNALLTARYPHFFLVFCSANAYLEQSSVQWERESKGEVVKPWQLSESQASCFNFLSLVADGSFAGVLNLLRASRELFLRMLHLFPREQTIGSHYNTTQKMRN